MSGVGGIVYDKDAVYIDLGGSHHHQKKDDIETAEPANELVGAMISTEKTLDEKIEESEIQLFSGSAPIKSGEFEDDVQMVNGIGSLNVQELDGRVRRKAIFDTEDEHLQVDRDDESDEDDSEASDEEDGEESGEDDDAKDKDSSKSTIRAALDNLKSGRKKKKSLASDSGNVSYDDDEDSNDDESSDVDKESEPSNEESEEEDEEQGRAEIVQRASDSYYDRLSNTTSLRKLVYGQVVDEKEDSEDESGSDEEAIGGLFKVLKRDQENKSTHAAIMNQEDSTKFHVDRVQDWTIDSICDSIRDCFVTGKWKESEDAEALLRMDDDDDEEDEVYGDFEDLETGEIHNAKSKEEMEEEDKPRIVEDEKELKKKRLEQKKLLKKKFDCDYDDEGNGKTHYDELKKEVEAQTMVRNLQSIFVSSCSSTYFLFFFS